MKSFEIRQFVVGCVALLALAVVLVMLYGRRNSPASAPSGSYRLTAAFNRIDGLAVGDEVLLSGIRVGRIQALALDHNYRARVTMTISDGVTLPADTAASIQTDGLFGNKFVVLIPGGDETMLHDGGSIDYTQDAIIVSDLLDVVIAEGRANQVPVKCQQDGSPGNAP